MGGNATDVIFVNNPCTCKVLRVAGFLPSMLRACVALCAGFALAVMHSV